MWPACYPLLITMDELSLQEGEPPGGPHMGDELTPMVVGAREGETPGATHG
jgi:hypothetical protein